MEPSGPRTDPSRTTTLVSCLHIPADRVSVPAPRPSATHFVNVAQAVIESEPQHVRTRLIELAAMVAAGDETEAVAK